MQTGKGQVQPAHHPSGKEVDGLDAFPQVRHDRIGGFAAASAPQQPPLESRRPRIGARSNCRRRGRGSLHRARMLLGQSGEASLLGPFALPLMLKVRGLKTCVP